MKIQLLPKKANVYKTALHVHTNISDGKFTPEEVRDIYKSKGFSVVAYTDHEVIVPHNDLNQEDFLSITSYEIAINQPHKHFDFPKVYHLNIYFPDCNTLSHFAFNIKKVWGNALKNVNEELIKNHYQEEYSIECINEIIAKSNELGCLVSYNHPVWSLQDRTDYIDLKGVWGVECYNTGGELEGYNETFAPIEDLLREGEPVIPLCTDDSHNLEQCGGGWAMVCADKLDYDSIFTALKNGDMYSSNGPSIYDVYFEDGYLYVKSSDAKYITLTSERRFACIERAGESPVNFAKFYIQDYIDRSLEHDKDPNKCYIRITVTDKNNKNAYTRAYYLYELLKK